VQLSGVRITNYRSVEDSGWVEVGDVTCLVGKNEAGKTAFLQALNKLNPVQGSSEFDDTMDFPSRHYAGYKRTREKEPAPVVSARFELSKQEMAEIAKEFGEGFMKSTRITVTKSYAPARTWGFSTDQSKAIEHFVASIEVPQDVKDDLLKTTTADDLAYAIDQLEEPHSTATALAERIRAYREERFDIALIDGYLEPWLPKFFYFDDYSNMPGRASIPDLIARRAAGTLDESEETLLRLLDMVGATLEEFQDESNFERLVRELEAAANGISEEVFKYWTQNPGLEVSALVSKAEPTAKPPLDQGPILNIRVRNPRHKVTVPFDERSKGFVWFFSFFAYFSELERQYPDTDLILLLDEPGLSLHATAQRDFLDFIDGRLKESCQVIYSTHSPFMIQANRLERVRTVEDIDDAGTKVSSEVMQTDAATVFPLQAALGYDLAQTLFVGPDCLLVEGPSDMLYLQVLNQALEADGREKLDERWVLTPAGGATNLVTFVSLLGSNQLNLAVLMDASSSEQQRIRNLLSTGHLKQKSIVLISDAVSAADADIEDLFEMGFYLELVNGAYSSELPSAVKVADISSGNPRTVIRVEEYFKTTNVAGTGRFNHYRPAAYLLSNQARLIGKINSATLDRAEALVKKINPLLS